LSSNITALIKKFWLELPTTTTHRFISFKAFTMVIQKPFVPSGDLAFMRGHTTGGVLPEDVFRKLLAYVSTHDSAELDFAIASQALAVHLQWSQPSPRSVDGDDVSDTEPVSEKAKSKSAPPTQSCTPSVRSSVRRRALGLGVHPHHPMSYCNNLNPYFDGCYFIDFLSDGHTFMCDATSLPSLGVEPSQFVVCPECNLSLRTWVRDLTREGVEPNPGPKRSGGRKRKNVKRHGQKRKVSPDMRQMKDSLTIRQVGDPITVSQSSAGNVYGSFNFTAGTSAQASQLVALFDQYKICSVQLDFRPRVTSFLQGTVPSGMLFTVLDFDDANVPSSTNQLEQYATVRILPLTKRVPIKLRPYFATAGNSQISGNVTCVPKRGWIDAAYTDVNHYGIKYAISQGVAGALQTYDVVITVIMTWRRVR